MVLGGRASAFIVCRQGRGEKNTSYRGRLKMGSIKHTEPRGGNAWLCVCVYVFVCSFVPSFLPSQSTSEAHKGQEEVIKGAD